MFKIYIMRIFFKIFYIFPVKKNRVVITAYNGRQYSCSPKYIAEKLKNENFEVLYALKDTCQDKLPEKIKKIKYKTLKHIYYLMTSKYIIVNSTGFTCMLPLRKKQVLINTWHGGGAFKTTGISHFNSKQDILKRKIIGNNTSYFISSSKVFGEQQAYSMCIEREKILNIGTPRNDIFFSKSNNEYNKKIRKLYKINEDYGIILYAPTYRDGKIKSLNDYELEKIDINRIIATAEDKFKKKFVFLFRAHHDMIPENIDSHCINVSEYGDIQELLYISDILITDYSSCMWDFALMYKPGFLYTPDLEKYQLVHKFASPIETWPYSYSKNNIELEEAIKKFDERENNIRIRRYFKNLESYEDGNATQKIINIIKRENL